MHPDTHFPGYLPDGSSIDIGNREGADEFIKKGGFLRFANHSIPKILDPLRKKDKPSHDDLEKLCNAYEIIGQFTGRCSPAVFQDYISRSELEKFFDHVNLSFKAISRLRGWKDRGSLQGENDQALFECALLSMFSHTSAVICALEMNVIRNLANLVSSLGERVPSRKESVRVCVIIANTISTLSSPEIDRSWPIDKALKRLEEEGALAQYIRCSVVCGDDLRVMNGLPSIYKHILASTALIKKYFVKGTPTGDVVEKILEEDARSNPDSKVICYLRDISKIAKTFSSDAILNTTTRNNMCRNCGKCEGEGEKFGNCSRCISAHYCSKKCQKDDWKKHKQVCKTTSKRQAKNEQADNQIINVFFQENLVPIMEKLISERKKLNVTSIADLNLEFDFVRTPTTFKVKETKLYFEGNKHNLPLWYDTDEERMNATTVHVKSFYENMTPNHLMIIAQITEKSVSCCKIQPMAPDKKVILLSDDSLNVLEKVIEKADVQLLRKYYGDQMARPMVINLAQRHPKIAQVMTKMANIENKNNCSNLSRRHGLDCYSNEEEVLSQIAAMRSTLSPGESITPELLTKMMGKLQLQRGLLSGFDVRERATQLLQDFVAGGGREKQAREMLPTMGIHKHLDNEKVIEHLVSFQTMADEDLTYLRKYLTENPGALLT